MMNISDEFMTTRYGGRGYRLDRRRFRKKKKKNKIKWKRERIVTIYAPQSRNCFVPVVNFLTTICQPHDNIYGQKRTGNDNVAVDEIAMIHAKWCLKRIYIDTRLKKDSIWSEKSKIYLYSFSL